MGETARTTTRSGAAPVLLPGLLLLAVIIAGIGGLLFFWNVLVEPDDFGAFSLPLVALVAGVAATFNPCGLPALPGFLAITGGSDDGMNVGHRSRLCLFAGLGAMSVIIAFGVIVGFSGAGAKGVIAPYFRWVQLGIGVALIGLAGLHLTDRSERLPFVGALAAIGSRTWEKSIGNPTASGSYLYGAGFVAVGAG